jgi:hypothetical protein
MKSNMTRFVLAWFAALVAIQLLSFLVHGLLLEAHYGRFPNLLRTQEEAARFFPVMLLAQALKALAAVWIYRMGVEQKPWLGQGLRFGAALWLVTSVPTFLIFYAVQPWTLDIVLRQIGYELVALLLLGMVIAAVHGGPSKAPAK